MKKILLLLILIAAGLNGVKAQEIRYIPAQKVRTLPDGWHKFVTNGVIFDVEVANGTLVKGNVKWIDNSSYSGSFSNNQISGRGTYTWANGDRYEGSFKNNERSGKGTMYWTNGTKFSGKWKYDKKNGKGKLWEADGMLKEGKWENDKMIAKS
ncbi:hypothetical protein GWK08_09385 [Leptobacterium flavescens]|uniref:Membrane-binding protein n=1 Tax=Leptobacterium flavescens TaxID=472055 RepID=A0A6P0UP85_9FLAO|nr:hypothetical protein [Leptobacterium flavescens]NER13649.1 hypothetical protein [Leptobacterium flavescens]